MLHLQDLADREKKGISDKLVDMMLDPMADTNLIENLTAERCDFCVLQVPTILGNDNPRPYL